MGAGALTAGDLNYMKALKQNLIRKALSKESRMLSIVFISTLDSIRPGGPNILKE